MGGGDWESNMEQLAMEKMLLSTVGAEQSNRKGGEV